MVNNYDIAVLSEKVAALEAAIKTAGIELPKVTDADNGKALQVVEGAWAKGVILDAAHLPFDSEHSIKNVVDSIIYEQIVDAVSVAASTVGSANLLSGKKFSDFNFIIGILYDIDYIRGSFVAARNPDNSKFDIIFEINYSGATALAIMKEVSDTSLTIDNRSLAALNFILRGIKIK